MLYVTNEDKPGFIGRLGTLLGNEKVNIANFNLGRAGPAATRSPLSRSTGRSAMRCWRRCGALDGVVQAKRLMF